MADAKSTKQTIRVLSSDHETVQIEFRNVPLHICHALRRIIMAEVPTMAINIVQVADQTSCMHDQMLNDRLALIPLTSTNVGKFIVNEACKCGSYCDKCSASFYLKARCPSDSPQESISVHASDMTPCAPKQTVLPVPEHAAGIEIVKLGRGQSMDLKLVATRGQGQKHAKWSPAHVGLRTKPIVRINNDLIKACSASEIEAIIKCCPRNVFSNDGSAKDGKDKKQVDRGDEKMQDIEDIGTSLQVNESNCSKCMACSTLCKHMGKPNLIQIGDDESDITMTIESKGQLPPARIVSMAFQLLHFKLQCLLPSLD